MKGEVHYQQKSTGSTWQSWTRDTMAHGKEKLLHWSGDWRSYGQLQELVVGAFQEVIDDIHALLDVIATKRGAPY